jgi:hypothetical protein
MMPAVVEVSLREESGFNYGGHQLQSRALTLCFARRRAGLEDYRPHRAGTKTA